MLDVTSTPVVRVALQKMRQKWALHSPNEPFCTCDELEEGVTYVDFCVALLTSQKSRTSVRTKEKGRRPLSCPKEEEKKEEKGKEEEKRLEGCEGREVERGGEGRRRLRSGTVLGERPCEEI